jgi:hypothetical protein
MKKSLAIMLLLACAALFGAGLFELFKLRFETGDVYPEYSSLRSDPLGAMALYESMEKLPGLSLRRDFSAQNQLPPGPGTAYLHLAASRLDWDTLPIELVDEIDRFVAAGGRLVIAFFPETHRLRVVGATTPTPARKRSAKSKAAEERLQGRVSLKQKWGVEFTSAFRPGREDLDRPVEVVNQTALPLPERIEWHSGMIFTNLDSSWNTIYSREGSSFQNGGDPARPGSPVLVERKIGRGTIVLASDCYFLSNEALLKDRHSDLLAWLVGAATLVVFDEAHLGIVETPGVASLIRKYRLQGLGIGVALVAALFVWKNTASFLPPWPDEPAPGTVSGREVSAGFINLLRRNIAPRDVLRVCFEEWTKSLPQGGGHSIAKVDQAQTVMEAENARAQAGRDPVRAYREICQVLRIK